VKTLFDPRGRVAAAMFGSGGIGLTMAGAASDFSAGGSIAVGVGDRASD
jgi:hypothetical protein